MVFQSILIYIYISIYIIVLNFSTTGHSHIALRFTNEEQKKVGSYFKYYTGHRYKILLWNIPDGYLLLCINMSFLLLCLILFILFIGSVYSLFIFLFNLVQINYMEWSMIPACPSLMHSFNRGNIEGTSMCLLFVYVSLVIHLHRDWSCVLTWK